MKPKREKKPRVKNDPKLVSAARELRDRYLEQINSGVLLPVAKYDVSRLITAPPPAAIATAQKPLLDAA